MAIQCGERKSTEALEKVRKQADDIFGLCREKFSTAKNFRDALRGRLCAFKEAARTVIGVFEPIFPNLPRERCHLNRRDSAGSPFRRSLWTVAFEQFLSRTAVASIFRRKRSHSKSVSRTSPNLREDLCRSSLCSKRAHKAMETSESQEAANSH